MKIVLDPSWRVSDYFVARTHGLLLPVAHVMLKSVRHTAVHGLLNVAEAPPAHIRIARTENGHID